MIWNSIPPDPVCTIQEKQTQLRNRENWGREEITAKEDMMHSNSRKNTCCLATVLVRLTSEYKKAM